MSYQKCKWCGGYISPILATHCVCGLRKAQESNHEQIPDFFYMEHDIQGER